MDNLLIAINSARFDNGLSALQLDDCLTQQAQNHADKMARTGRMNHNGFSERLQNCSKNMGSENVAAGQSNATECVSAWINSTGHNKNMMGKWSVCGVGEKNRYWCAIFS